jgi:hypothetical protein
MVPDQAPQITVTILHHLTEFLREIYLAALARLHHLLKVVDCMNIYGYYIYVNMFVNMYMMYICT